METTISDQRGWKLGVFEVDVYRVRKIPATQSAFFCSFFCGLFEQEIFDTEEVLCEHRHRHVKKEKEFCSSSSGRMQEADVVAGLDEDDAAKSKLMPMDMCTTRTKKMNFKKILYTPSISWFTRLSVCFSFARKKIRFNLCCFVRRSLVFITL